MMNNHHIFHHEMFQYEFSSCHRMHLEMLVFHVFIPLVTLLRLDFRIFQLCFVNFEGVHTQCTDVRMLFRHKTTFFSIVPDVLLEKKKLGHVPCVCQCHFRHYTTEKHHFFVLKQKHILSKISNHDCCMKKQICGKFKYVPMSLCYKKCFFKK